MLGSGTLLDALLADPLAFYPALAALLLASVALASGLLRGDVLALAKPLPVAWTLLAVAGCWGIQRALELPAAAGWDVPAVVAAAPLALVALAYGPTPALIALALTAAWVGVPGAGAAPTSADTWLLGLELVVLGWLAIAPSPRSWPLVAGPYLLLGHALTWATAGLAWVVLTSGAATLASFGAHHGFGFGGLGLLALALALLPPSFWRAAFPGSSIAPPGARPEARRATPAPAPAADDLAPWSRSRARHRDLERLPLEAPAPFLRQRRRRGHGEREPGRTP